VADVAVGSVAGVAAEDAAAVDWLAEASIGCSRIAWMIAGM
jgi:hypothetical protein